jgi:hypothetical protein
MASGARWAESPDFTPVAERGLHRENDLAAEIIEEKC